MKHSLECTKGWDTTTWHMHSFSTSSLLDLYFVTLQGPFIHCTYTDKRSFRATTLPSTSLKTHWKRTYFFGGIRKRTSSNYFFKEAYNDRESKKKSLEGEQALLVVQEENHFNQVELLHHGCVGIAGQKRQMEERWLSLFTSTNWANLWKKIKEPDQKLVQNFDFSC